MPQSLLTGQLKEKPTYRVGVFIVHSSMVRPLTQLSPEIFASALYNVMYYTYIIDLRKSNIFPRHFLSLPFYMLLKVSSCTKVHVPL
jgi:hypothetical protein